MSQYIQYNSPAYNTKQKVIKLVSPRKVCICCLAQDGTMVNLINCRHKRFLQDYFLMDYPMGLVCSNCHKMLEKIQTFKNQVEEACKILKQQGLQRFKNKFKLIQSVTTITSITNNINKINSKVKDELDLYLNDDSETDLHNEIASDIKIKVENIMDSKVKDELDSYLNDDSETDSQNEFTSDIELKTQQDSDFENDLPVTKITQQKKKQKCVKVLQEVVSLEEKYDGKIQFIILSKEALMEERERESKREEYVKMLFKCEKCIKGFDHEVTLKRHIEKQHNKESIYRCEVCDSVFATEFSFKEHLRRHVYRYECMACKMRTNNIFMLTSHFNQNHAELGFINQEFKCEDCEFATDSDRNYKRHRRTHTDRKRCFKCDKIFSTPTGLKTHMTTVHSDTSIPRSRLKYNCSICDKVYLNKTPLKHHMVNVHGDGPDSAYCDKCGKHYTSSHALQQHLKTHSAHATEADKKYVCHDCGAKFSTKPPLRVHIEWEHLKKVYQCKICSKVLRSAITLKNHHRFVHEKKALPKNKICDHCGKAFSSTNILRTHIRTHTGERPLVCVHCSATFAHAAALYTHKKLKHKSLKPIESIVDNI